MEARTDVAREDDIVALFEKTMGTFGGLHIAFNNAGAEGAAPGFCREIGLRYFKALKLQNL